MSASLLRFRSSALSAPIFQSTTWSSCARGIDTEGLQVAEGQTFRWSGFYDYDLNQAHTRQTDLNVFADFHPRLPEAYRDARIVFWRIST